MNEYIMHKPLVDEDNQFFMEGIWTVISENDKEIELSMDNQTLKISKEMFSDHFVPKEIPSGFKIPVKLKKIKVAKTSKVNMGLLKNCQKFVVKYDGNGTIQIKTVKKGQGEEKIVNDCVWHYMEICEDKECNKCPVKVPIYSREGNIINEIYDNDLAEALVPVRTKYKKILDRLKEES